MDRKTKKGGTKGDKYGTGRGHGVTQTWQAKRASKETKTPHKGGVFLKDDTTERGCSLVVQRNGMDMEHDVLSEKGHRKMLKDIKMARGYGKKVPWPLASGSKR